MYFELYLSKLSQLVKLFLKRVQCINIHSGINSSKLIVHNKSIIFNNYTNLYIAKPRINTASNTTSTTNNIVILNHENTFSIIIEL